jgi:LPXTG-motif cell wall-anchored protein
MLLTLIQVQNMTTNYIILGVLLILAVVLVMAIMKKRRGGE